jgi:predicted Zn-dependent protease
MTDDKSDGEGKKRPEEAGEVDWDSALSDWETKTFVPEVAKDVMTDKPASLSGNTVSRPLYRPPVPSPKGGKGPPPPPARPPPPRVGLIDDDDDEQGATVISTIPRELLKRKEPPRPRPPAPAPSRSGGLGQFFARDDRRESGASNDEAGSKSATRARDELRDDGARGPEGAPPKAERSGVGPLRRPSAGAGPAEPADGEMFDPFAEPRPEQLTIPAESELAELLDSPAIERPSPSLLSPDARRYDPEEETVVGRLDDILPGGAPSSKSSPASRRATTPPPLPVPPSFQPPSFQPPSFQPPSFQPPSFPPRHEESVREVAADRRWDDERPAATWLDESARAAFRERAAWLEQEARALDDDESRGRALLTCSEILATAGDRDRAEMLAKEARDLAPGLALAHRQVRGLIPPSLDASELLEALDSEIGATPPGPARTHAILLATDAAAAGGDDDQVAERLEQIARAAPNDVRAAVGRAARALRQTDAAGATALRFAEARELTPIAEALRFCARLREAPTEVGPSVASSANEVLMRARNALDGGDLSAAARLVSELAAVPELARGALWLAASLGAVRSDRRPQAAAWLRELVDLGEEQAFRPLAARTLEVGDGAALARALERPGPIALPERLALATLGDLGAAADPYLHPTAAAGMEALACAAAAVGVPMAGDPQRAARLGARTRTTAGSPESRGLVELGRLLGSSAPSEAIEQSLSALGAAAPAPARAVALEIAVRGRRMSDVSATLEAWAAARTSPEERAAGALASAIVAERAGDRDRALHGFKAARAADATSEAALRAIASLEPVDLVAEMNALADELGEGTRAAVARIEAVTLGEGVLPEPTQTHLLASAHRAAPTLPIAAFLAERIARRAGDVEEVLLWIRDRRATTNDPIDAALDAVREALLVADREPALAAERLREAQEARPTDVALRELYERMTPEPPDDRAAWREARAAEAGGQARVLLLLEAARENEGAGDEEGALRCAEAAANEGAALAQVARERAELRTGRVARLSDELFSQAKSADDPRRRREAFERLADLDLLSRRDAGSAMLWHRSIFEDQPDHKPSLRYLEQHLVGEGRDEEIEPVVSAIAVALKGTGSGECTAHAELAARLRMRGTTGSWDSTRDMVDVAAAEIEPSLWALRMLQSHSRIRGEDATYLEVTKRLIERTSKPVEVATLLVRAAEAAVRLGNGEEAQTLTERATREDPGDVVAWDVLVETRKAGGDLRGAAEASESLAACALVPERQLGAWYMAGRLWQDDVKDEPRALAALESAAAINVAYDDVFDRLSRIYASRKMQPELAQLLERRMDCVTDPDERRAIEVRRGRVLFEAGDVTGAREAYESALADRPDDAQALAAFTDLCLAQGDWEVAEQSLIRLARLLPTPDEQRVVYSQLGDLYANHLLNLPRAEVALKEVLKCAPDDLETAAKLVDVYKRQNDAPRALELQQELLQKSQAPEEKRQRIVELALIHEEAAQDNRKAEQVLEGGRREFPQDVGLLRALAEFYARHRQTPAFNILLDRASADARRALTAGRLTPASFEVLATVFELRGRADAARVSRAMLATLEGEAVDLPGAGAERALDAQLDDLLAPEVLTPSLRGLLARTGDALDAVAPIDVRLMKAVPIDPAAPIARLVARAGQALGLGGLILLSSPKLGAVCIPVGSSPPTLVLGESLVSDEHNQHNQGVGAFLALRALKLVRVKASALGRTVPGELGVLVSAWLKCFNPSWSPQGINPSSLTTALGRIQATLPKNLTPDVAVLALEVAGAIGTRQATLGPAALAWANRVAFLALGDPNAALDAIASAGSPGAIGVAGPPKSAPRDPKERAAWVARTPEARDLVAFGVTDAFAEARARLNLG